MLNVLYGRIFASIQLSQTSIRGHLFLMLGQNDSVKTSTALQRTPEIELENSERNREKING